MAGAPGGAGQAASLEPRLGGRDTGIRMEYMLAAYSVIWVLTFIFIASISIRQRRLHRDLEVMQQLLEEQAPEDDRA